MNQVMLLHCYLYVSITSQKLGDVSCKIKRCHFIIQI